MAWATTDDVRDLTGSVVDVATVTQAQGVIEMVGSVRESVTAVTVDDAEWLRRAVAYQAAFIAANPGLFGTMEVASESLDGHRTDFRDEDPYAGLLSPLAKRALAHITVIADGTAVPAFSFEDAPDETPVDWVWPRDTRTGAELSLG